MHPVPHNRVLVITGTFSTLSIGVVFAAAGGKIPASLLPTAPEFVISAIPHINAVISCLAILAIGLGWYWIRAGNIRYHRIAMLSTFGLFLLFLNLYLYRLTIRGGPVSFPGPNVIEQFVYLPVLAIHIVLAVICIPLLYYVLALALTRPISELPQTLHPRVGRVAAILWMLSFSLGLVVYGLLYHLY